MFILLLYSTKEIVSALLGRSVLSRQIESCSWWLEVNMGRMFRTLQTFDDVFHLQEHEEHKNQEG